VGVVISADTKSDIIAYCPFHKNNDSPALNISLRPPHKWKCWNGKCNKRGNILSLLMMKGYTKTEAERIIKKGAYEVSDLYATVVAMMADPKEEARDEWRSVDYHDFIDQDRLNGYPVKSYMASRGVGEAAYNYFSMGYSKRKNMAVIPVFDERHQLAGVIGRELHTKRYQYSTGLARGRLIWNIQNAKLHQGIILTEGALDAVAIWQAGFENVGAVLGSAISPDQWRILRNYFTEITCFFDNDDAGQALTESIIDTVSDITVNVVTYPDRLVDGRPVKDPGELEVAEIQEMLLNRKTSIQWFLED
jgi:5S rRNA maturation endonuclease (ribonuclease M5)